MDNMEEMYTFLEKYYFPKLNPKEIENLNRPITRTEIEAVIRNLPKRKKKKTQDQKAAQLKSTKNLEKTYHLSYSNYFRKLQRKVNCQIHSLRPPSP